MARGPPTVKELNLLELKIKQDRSFILLTFKEIFKTAVFTLRSKTHNLSLTKSTYKLINEILGFNFFDSVSN